MSGRWNDSGQLALLDAIVFFMAAMLASTILFSSVPDSGDIDAKESGSWFDADRALASVLRSSIGSEIEISIHAETIVLTERTEIADCILLEAHVIAEGDDASDFGALNCALSIVIASVCGQSMRAQLCVFEVRDGSPSQLFSVPGIWADAAVTRASTSELADSDGNSFVVQLRSAPATSLEPA